MDNQADSLPKNLTLDEYAVAVVQIDIGETSQQRVTAAIRGLLMRAYYNLAAGDEDRYENLKNLARRVHEHYDSQTTSANGKVRVPLMPFPEMQTSVVRLLLDPQGGVPYAARAALVTRLGLPSSMLQATPPEATAPTNAVEPAATAPGPTNAPVPAAP